MLTDLYLKLYYLSNDIAIVNTDSNLTKKLGVTNVELIEDHSNIAEGGGVEALVYDTGSRAYHNILMKVYGKLFLLV